MNLYLHHIEKEINHLIGNCCKKPYKNKESIRELKMIYENLLGLRSEVISQHPGFPGDPGTEAIIHLLGDMMGSKVDLKKVEWSYDHYIDLFKFKAEELLLESLERFRESKGVLSS